MTDFKKNAAYFAFFVLAASFFTYPLVFHMGSELRGSDIGALGDPMFNTWVIGRNIDRIVRLDFEGFFNGNIFYPQTKTVLYSENLLPQSLIALPVQVLTGNPILGYNFAFLLGFILSGFGMFCLARHLTKSVPAGIVAGLIYAFCPFMMAHMFQIQIITAWGIPFAFLCLHRYAETGRLKDILGFTFFYVVQSMANGYFGLFLTFFAGAWIVYLTFIQKKYRDRRWFAHLGLFAGVSAVILGPLFWLYARTHAEMGFSRAIDFYARLTSFLSVPKINRLYERLFRPFSRPEGELFPGFAAVVLAAIGIILFVRSRRVSAPPGGGTKRGLLAVRRVLNIFIVLVSVIVIFIIGQNGLDLSLNGLQIFRAHNLRRALIPLVLLVVARILLDLTSRFRRPAAKDPDVPILGGYAVTLLLAFLFTFGPKGPYYYLYEHVPGFQSIRVASRFQVFVMFALAVLAAFGLRTLIRRFRKPRPATAAVVLCAGLIGLEFLSISVPYGRLPLRNQIPETYRWLMANKTPGVLIEMPLPSYNKGSASIEGLRMYYSLFHRNTLVNGYSGYFPPLYTELCRREEFHDFMQLIDDFQALNVDYLLVHFDEVSEDLKPGWLARLGDLKKDLRLIHNDGDDYLFEMIRRPSRTGEVRSLAGYVKLDRAGWTVKTTINEAYTGNMLDGDPKTRWESGPQVPDVYLEIDLKKPQAIRCVSLRFGPSSLDFPRAYKLELSPDGQDWSEVAREAQTVVPILGFVKPTETSLDITFPVRTARYVRITNFGRDPVYYWSVHELEIYQ